MANKKLQRKPKRRKVIRHKAGNIISLPRAVERCVPLCPGERLMSRFPIRPNSLSERMCRI